MTFVGGLHVLVVIKEKLIYVDPRVLIRAIGAIVSILGLFLFFLLKLR